MGRAAHAPRSPRLHPGLAAHASAPGAPPITPVGPGKFGGQIPAFTGLDNGQHTAFLTPWRDAIQGETLGVAYVIVLLPPGYEVSWETGDVDGHVVALGVLPDGRPFEFGTYYEMGEPRCYLRVHAKTGEPEEIVPLLPSAHCSAIDATIDRDTGEIHVLVERLSGQGLRWWAGWIPAWGLGPVNIGIGEPEHKAYALASRPGLVAVCGSKLVATPDGLDALAVLLRPNEPPEERLFDLESSFKHWFAETTRDCIFADGTLVLVGEAYGKHETDVDDPRDRFVVIEHDVDANTSEWIVAGPGPRVQSRGLAIHVDDEGSATACWSRWPSAWRTAFARATPQRAWATTNSSSCSTTWGGMRNPPGCRRKSSPRRFVSNWPRPYLLQADTEYFRSASVGISLFYGHDKSVDVLLKQADIALYKAKDAGRNTIRFFDCAMQTALDERAALEAGLRRALSRDELILHVQPQVNAERQLIGAEVLLRWHPPKQPMVLPSDFIPLA